MNRIIDSTSGTGPETEIMEKLDFLLNFLHPFPDSAGLLIPIIPDLKLDQNRSPEKHIRNHAGSGIRKSGQNFGFGTGLES